MGDSLHVLVQPGDQTKVSALLQSFAEESKARAALASAGEGAEQASADTGAEDGQPVKKQKTMDASEADVRVPPAWKPLEAPPSDAHAHPKGLKRRGAIKHCVSTMQCCLSVDLWLQELAEQEKTIDTILSKFVLEKAPHNYKVRDDQWRSLSYLLLSCNLLLLGRF